MSEQTSVSLNVRAKFFCTKREEAKAYSGGITFGYTMQPVYGDSEENKSFWQAMPNGKLELWSIHTDLFKVGAEYYLDFTPANLLEATNGPN